MSYNIILCNSIKESAWIFNNYSIRILFYINRSITLVVSMRQRIKQCFLKYPFRKILNFKSE